MDGVEEINIDGSPATTDSNSNEFQDAVDTNDERQPLLPRNEEGRRVKVKCQRLVCQGGRICAGLYALLLTVTGFVISVTQIFMEHVTNAAKNCFDVYLLGVGFFCFLALFVLSKWTKVERNPHAGSLYLKFGTVLFGLGSALDAVIDFLDRLWKEDILVGVVESVLRLLFTIIMIGCLLTYVNTVYLEYKWLVNLSVMHLVATSLCAWADVLIHETAEDLKGANKREMDVTKWLNPKWVHSIDAFVISENVSPTSRVTEIMPTKEEATNGMFEQVIEQATPFLYPCTVEFNLIVAGSLYIIWRSVGKPRQHDTARKEDHGNEKCAAVIESIDCSNSTLGFLVGIVVLIIGVAAIVIFVTYDGDKTRNYKTRRLALVLYQAMHVFISGLMCVALGWVFFFFKWLDFDKKKDIALDGILLIVSLTGLFALAIFNVISALAFYTDVSPFKTPFEDEDVTPFRLTLTIALFQILEAGVQTVCILDGLRRRPGPNVPDSVKHSRQFITFLLVCNVSLWILSTFEVKCPQTSPVSLLLYRGVGWCIISHLSMPMVIFFRFHSAACMFEIWKEAFTDKPATPEPSTQQT